MYFSAGWRQDSVVAHGIDDPENLIAGVTFRIFASGSVKRLKYILTIKNLDGRNI
jgi:hypothetical protein